MVLALERRVEQDGGMDLGGAERPTVARLALSDFRSYAALDVRLDARPVVLTGLNGAGKTNLLEAVSLLSPGRGLRRARLAELDRVGSQSFAIAARLQTALGAVELGTGRVQVGERERRAVHVDGVAAASQTALADHLAVLWLTPAMDRLFLEGAGERRRFLDRLVLAADPGHAARVADYGKALQERSRLLKAGRREPAWLAALERRAVAAGVAIAVARRQSVRALQTVLATNPGRFPRPDLGLAGDLEGWLEHTPALDVEQRFAEGLAASRRADAASGTTGLGPHRSDLLVHDPVTGAPARQCSTGQQKAFLISIVLAEARHRAATGGRLPLLLLDEIAAHLDVERRGDLFAELLELGSQAWLTGTDASIFQPLADRAQWFSIRNSKLSCHDPA